MRDATENLSEAGGSRAPCQGRLHSLLQAAVVALLVVYAGGCGSDVGPVHVTQEIAEGWARFRVDDFDEAIRHFKRAVEHSEGRGQQPAEALYGLANVWNHRRPGADPERARKLYEEVGEQYPETDAAAWSLLALARLEHLARWGIEGNSPEVQAAYQRVIDRFPHHLAGEEAFLYQQSNILVTLDAEVIKGAALATKEFIENHPQSPYICIAYHVLSACYAEMGDPIACLQAKERAVNTIVDDGVTPIEIEEVVNTWLVAFDAQKEVGDFETARKYYRRIIERWPGSPVFFATERAQKEMDEKEEAIRDELRTQCDNAAPEETPEQKPGLL